MEIAKIDAMLSVVSALLLSWVVLQPKLQEGLWIKAGLICLVFAMMANAALLLQGVHSLQAFLNIGLTIRLGVVLCCVGVVLKVGVTRMRQRRAGHKAKVIGVLQEYSDGKHWH